MPEPSASGADKVVRLCVPVDWRPFIILEVPTAIVGKCYQCGTFVWVDSKQEVPAALSKLPTHFLCLECAAADEKIAQSMARNLPAAIQQYVTTNTTFGWLVNHD